MFTQSLGSSQTIMIIYMGPIQEGKPGVILNPYSLSCKVMLNFLPSDIPFFRQFSNLVLTKKTIRLNLAGKTLCLVSKVFPVRGRGSWVLGAVCLPPCTTILSPSGYIAPFP